MDRELARCVEALRRPLMLAAADRFAGLRKVKGLGHALRAACDGLLQKLEAEQVNAQLAAWRAQLGAWEQLGEEQQEIEIARGMRLIALMPREAKPVVTKTAPTFTLPSQKPPSEKPPSEKPASDKPSSDKPPSDKAASEKPPSDKPPSDKPPSDKAASAKPSPGDKPPRGGRPPAPIVDPLAAPTHTLPGIGPAFAERLAEKGLETVEDLL
ncbi:MAG TPA: hypothetical protein VIV11_10155, partial [Kofleriaceae bacterium]